MTSSQSTTSNPYPRSLFWFRRDLRHTDNAGLYRALTQSAQVHCVFVFDKTILDALPNKADRRVEFIWESVRELQTALREAGGDLIVLHAHAEQAIPALAASLDVQAVFTNEDYEPSALVRDDSVATALAAQGRAFHAFKDHAIFAADEVMSKTGQPYSVFTPYKNAWLRKLNEHGSDFYVRAYPCENYWHKLAAPTKGLAQTDDLPSLEAMGFARTNLLSIPIPTGMRGALQVFDEFMPRMDRYFDQRNFPAVRGVSYLSVHNRFGTISPRYLARLAWQRNTHGASGWLNELVWRDFYFHILTHYPHVVGHAFKRKYENLAWENDAEKFAAWCEARTGYPIVDAAMQQILQTGFMHNRLRMIVASFLTKHLLIDWRWGERFFAEHLNDFDLAANNGGWQWAASTGCDAQPYFRIFNPVMQSEKFDAEGKFIRRYLPALEKVPSKFIHAPWTMPSLEQKLAGCVIGTDYPAPIVEHAVAREKALALFKVLG
ncbi:cryptochrome/photolyase family protein [Parvibium lacunae]|uniref:Deoxyribodipyrimidine photo-lyase n=1 Tax=Parvibium lacunae TaxID=1888893 RepID=A0A368L7F0_9BURK|nr:deoxyribodipyrimidine photo-lyase [Parvibium lacunae]RCS59537.1 deoxyribodipyrimidine photo-lyase [Parvibium lacunae]